MCIAIEPQAPRSRARRPSALASPRADPAKTLSHRPITTLHASAQVCARWTPVCPFLPSRVLLCIRLESSLGRSGVARTNIHPAIRGLSPPRISRDPPDRPGRCRSLVDATWSSALPNTVPRLPRYYITPRTRLSVSNGLFEFVPETVLCLVVSSAREPWNTEHSWAIPANRYHAPLYERWEDEHGLIPSTLPAHCSSRATRWQGRGSPSVRRVGAAPAVRPGVGSIDLIGNNPGAPALGDGAPRVPAAVRRRQQHGVVVRALMTFCQQCPYLASLHSNAAKLSIYGAYIDLDGGPVANRRCQLLRRHCVDGDRSKRSFTSGYLQVERQLPGRFTIFGRLEDSARMQESRYVALFDDADGDIEIALWD